MYEKESEWERIEEFIEDGDVIDGKRMMKEGLVYLMEKN